MKAETYTLATIADIGIIHKAMNRVLVNNVKDQNQKIGVLIQNATSIRNLKQNALIHVIFQLISDASASTGNGKRIPVATIKAALKDRYLGYHTTKLKSKIVYELKSTAKMTKKKCREFTENILEWCIEHNIEIQIMTEDYNYLMGKP